MGDEWCGACACATARATSQTTRPCVGVMGGRGAPIVLVVIHCHPLETRGPDEGGERSCSFVLDLGAMPSLRVVHRWQGGTTLPAAPSPHLPRCRAMLLSPPLGRHLVAQHPQQRASVARFMRLQYTLVRRRVLPMDVTCQPVLSVVRCWRADQNDPGRRKCSELDVAVCKAVTCNARGEFTARASSSLSASSSSETMCTTFAEDEVFGFLNIVTRRTAYSYRGPNFEFGWW